jgi:hypothetical protein
MAPPIVRVIRPGDSSKANPFTICVVSNPALEAPWRSGTFIIDPVTLARPDFESSVRYIEQALFGGLPNQAETFLSDPTIAPGVRLVSLFVQGLPPIEANALVAQDGESNLLVARRAAFNPFLAQYGLAADVVYAISQSRSHTRAPGYPSPSTAPHFTIGISAGSREPWPSTQPARL